MTPISQTPVYNLSAVLRETGLSADVLRAWERRYDLPRPHRTPGGHRLYSQYDVETVKWLRARQAEGLTISRAVDLWKELVKSGREPLAGLSTTVLSEGASRSLENKNIDLLRSSWVSACLSFDAVKAEEVVNQAFAMYSVEMVCFEILQKGVSEIGQLWYEDKVSVQQEHFATALAIRRIETLITNMPNATREKTILTGCPPGEWHSFPVLIMTLLLRRKGFNVIYLGTNIPMEQLEQTIRSIRPALGVLAAQQLSTAASLQSTAWLFQKLGIPLAYGGLVFNRIPDLRARIPAFFLGEDLNGAIDRIEQLITFPMAFPDIIREEKIYIEAAAAFRSKQPLIEARLMGILEEQGLTGDNMLEVNTFFAAWLSSALELGDPGLLETDLEWVKNLLVDRRIPAERLNPYLAAYQQAVESEMGEAGKSITRWIVSYLAKN
jgi:methanogenic corrinoid protein MtbC1